MLRQGKWSLNCRNISYRWTSGKDRGQADAVNKGFTLAKGEILGWLNSDDTYLEGAISKVVDHFKCRQHSLMVYGNAYYTDKNGTVTSSYPSEPFNLQRLAETCFICQPSVFMRAEVIDEVGQLDVNLQASMDYDLWIRIGKRFAARIAFIDDYLATSRMYPENKTIKGIAINSIFIGI